ncbi:MAG: iron-sulfur cluster assembly scaffold protein [Promethearchaeota archaeon]
MGIRYNKKVMEHFMNPKNVGTLEDADTVIEEGNPVCGDMLRMYLKIEEGKIKDIKFLSFGCAANIATASVITELAKGRTLEEAKKITMKEVAENLDNLPRIKMHCAALAAKALQKAIEEYRESEEAKEDKE